jgi:hypothetical protein
MSKRKRGRTAKAQSLTKVRPKAAHSGEHTRRANSKQARVLGLLRRYNRQTVPREQSHSDLEEAATRRNVFSKNFR